MRIETTADALCDHALVSVTGGATQTGHQRELRGGGSSPGSSTARDELEALLLEAQGPGAPSRIPPLLPAFSVLDPAG
jgi:hypothetical protein